ncbi:DNA binding protein [Aureococcus anophagefferens]|nr:DNA binding protein [Aureococcus anophagefferens]
MGSRFGASFRLPRRGGDVPRATPGATAVAKFGTSDINWLAVAKIVGARNNKQCRARWHNNLRPGVKKGNWSAKEDALISALPPGFSAWASLLKKLPGRTDINVKHRYDALLKRPGSAAKGSAAAPEPKKARAAPRAAPAAATTALSADANQWFPPHDVGGPYNRSPRVGSGDGFRGDGFTGYFYGYGGCTYNYYNTPTFQSESAPQQLYQSIAYIRDGPYLYDPAAAAFAAASDAAREEREKREAEAKEAARARAALAREAKARAKAKAVAVAELEFIKPSVREIRECALVAHARSSAALCERTETRAAKAGVSMAVVKRLESPHEGVFADVLPPGNPFDARDGSEDALRAARAIVELLPGALPASARTLFGDPASALVVARIRVDGHAVFFASPSFESRVVSRATMDAYLASGGSLQSRFYKKAAARALSSLSKLMALEALESEPFEPLHVTFEGGPTHPARAAAQLSASTTQPERTRARVARGEPLTREDVDSLDYDEAFCYAGSMGKSPTSKVAYFAACRAWFDGHPKDAVFDPRRHGALRDFGAPKPRRADRRAARERVERGVPLAREDIDSLKFIEAREYVRSMGVTTFRHSRYASFQRQLNNFGFHRQNGTAGQTTIYRREGAAEGAPVESILNLRHVLRRSSGGKQNAEAGGRAQEPDGTPRPAKRPRAPRRETAGRAEADAAVFDAAPRRSSSSSPPSPRSLSACAPARRPAKPPARRGRAPDPAPLLEPPTS